MSFRIGSRSFEVRPWALCGVLSSLLVVVNCGGPPDWGGGGGGGTGGEVGTGGYPGTGGFATGGEVGTGGYLATGGEVGTGGYPGVGGQGAGAAWGVGGEPVRGDDCDPDGGTGGVPVHDREACDRRHDECLDAVDALCAVLDHYDCESLATECTLAQQECLQSWIATCPRGVSECYDRVDLCYAAGLPLELCDEMFFGCGDEARACLEAMSPDDPELPEDDIEFLVQSAAAE
ncbi:MAG: hypothetical protein GX607_08815 [Myxococcales bacterium]|nr:hypothetical protein [Myxococcales bacterium]